MDVSITPPASEGRLESITLEIVRRICHSLAIPFIERPVDRTELHIADEIRLVGTLAELAPVDSGGRIRIAVKFAAYRSDRGDFLGCCPRRGATSRSGIDIRLDGSDL